MTTTVVESIADQGLASRELSVEVGPDPLADLDRASTLRCSDAAVRAGRLGKVRMLSRPLPETPVAQYRPSTAGCDLDDIFRDPRLEMPVPTVAVAAAAPR